MMMPSLAINLLRYLQHSLGLGTPFPIHSSIGKSTEIILKLANYPDMLLNINSMPTKTIGKDYTHSDRRLVRLPQTVLSHIWVSYT